MADNNNTIQELVDQLQAQPQLENEIDAVQRNLILNIVTKMNQMLVAQPAVNNQREEAQPVRLSLKQARDQAAEGGIQYQPLSTGDLFPTKWSNVQESGPTIAHIRQVEDYFTLQGYTSFQQQMPWFKASLAKEARIWVEEKELSFTSWNQVKREFIKHWDNAPCEHIAIQKYRNIEWDGNETADEYRRRISKLAKILGYDNKEILAQFQFGLPTPVKLFFESNKPSNIDEAVQKLQAYADIYKLGVHKKPELAPLTPSVEQYRELLTQLLPLGKNLKEQENKSVTFDNNKADRGRLPYKRERRDSISETPTRGRSTSRTRSVERRFNRSPGHERRGTQYNTYNQTTNPAPTYRFPQQTYSNRITQTQAQAYKPIYGRNEIGYQTMPQQQNIRPYNTNRQWQQQQTMPYGNSYQLRQQTPFANQQRAISYSNNSRKQTPVYIRVNRSFDNYNPNQNGRQQYNASQTNKCHGCGSIQHFVRECPLRSGKMGQNQSQYHF